VSDLDPTQVVASFDSASVLHAATVAALNGRPFPHLGSSALAGLAVRAASRLPWSVLRSVYTRIGASEGINPRRLGDVNLAAVAGSFADRYPKRPYPAILLGSSNGALTHLGAAMQVPWLPDTVLVPVARVGDTDRPDQAMEFGRSVAPALLDRNPDIALHHMHDQLQDVLMAERMSYFRVKWSRLPDAYAAFVESHLAPGGTVVVINDSSSWRWPGSVRGMSFRPVGVAARRQRDTWQDRTRRRRMTRRPNPNGVSIRPSATTFAPGVISAAIDTSRSDTSGRRRPPPQWQRSCATGIALAASLQIVSSSRASFWATPGRPSAPQQFRSGSTFQCSLRWSRSASISTRPSHTGT
jgi:hypothetical protein